MNDVKRFSFFRSYWEAMESMNDKEAGQFIKSMCTYAFENTEPNFTGMASKVKVGFSIVKPLLDTNIKQSIKGGRPKKDKSQN